MNDHSVAGHAGDHRFVKRRQHITVPVKKPGLQVPQASPVDLGKLNIARLRRRWTGQLDTSVAQSVNRGLHLGHLNQQYWIFKQYLNKSAKLSDFEFFERLKRVAAEVVIQVPSGTAPPHASAAMGVSADAKLTNT